MRDKKKITLWFSMLAVVMAVMLFPTAVRAAGISKEVDTKEAFLAALSDETVTHISLTAPLELTTPVSEGYYVLDLSGKTIDLGGHTITSTIHMNPIFQGKDFTLKNGSFASSLPDGKKSTYPLFIGDEGMTDHVLLEDITVIDGGINVYNARNVTLRNVTSTGRQYYAVWCDENAHVTIEGGTYKTNGAAVLGITDIEENVPPSTMTIEGGTFETNGKPLVLESSDPNVVHGAPVIKGGSFDVPVKKKYLDTALEFEVNNSGTYTYHTTMEEALEAAEPGATITPTESTGSAILRAELDYNDGTGTVLHLVGNGENKITLPALDRKGYRLEGWSDGSTVYQPETQVAIKGGETFTAQWSALVSQIMLDKTKLQLKEKETGILKAEVSPADAADSSLLWFSSDRDIVVVDQTGQVTAQSAGTAVITVKAADGSETEAQCAVEVFHDGRKMERKEPTETETGNIEYWRCNICGKCFTDAEMTQEIQESETILAAAGNGQQAAGAWRLDGTGWWYLYRDGHYPAGQWDLIDGVWYRFNSDGYMQTGWYQNHLGDWFWLREDGAMVSGWEMVHGIWYYFHDNGVMAAGWHLDGNTWYYLNKNGAMKTGWHQNHLGDWFWLNESGAMQTGWELIDGIWYYFYDNGVMAENTYVGDYYVDYSGAWIE